MANFPFGLIGFDLDGTLIDTSADLGAAVNHALAREGRPPIAVAEVRPLIGGGARMMLERGLKATGGLPDEERITELHRALLAYYGDHLSVHSRPFPGALAALDDLAARGVKLAIVTNKFERFATRLIADLGLTERFVTILGGDTLGPGRSKPAPDPIVEMMARAGIGPERTAFVGDSAFDVGAAHAAGVPVIAVSFGFLMGPVGNLGANTVIDHYDALVPALSRLAPRPPATP